jgi:hypothetical protein
MQNNMLQLFTIFGKVIGSVFHAANYSEMPYETEA